MQSSLSFLFLILSWEGPIKETVNTTGRTSSVKIIVCFFDTFRLFTLGPDVIILRLDFLI
jgi:hypothetical protein